MSEARSAAAAPPSRPPAPAAAAAAAPASALPHSYSQLALTFESARLATSGGARAALLRPNPYVEVIVDGKPPRRTETAKSTYSPRWCETMTLLVTPYSKMLLRLYDHSSFKKDALLGEHSVDLFTLLRKHEGNLDGVSLQAELRGPAGKHSHGEDRGQTVQTGTLNLALGGLRVDPAALQAAGPGGAGVSVVPSPQSQPPNGSSSLAALSNGSAASPASPGGAGADPSSSSSNGGVRPRPPRPAPPVTVNGANPSSSSSSNSTPTAAARHKKGSSSRLPPLDGAGQSSSSRAQGQAAAAAAGGVSSVQQGACSTSSCCRFLLFPLIRLK